MRAFFFITVLFLFPAFSKGQTIQLSPQSSISLLTISPGKELYSSFGHSTLLIEDYQNGISVMYNYGSFDFETENFYVKFLRGTLPYQLTKNGLNTALEYWTSEGRLVTKQQLRLSLQDRQKIYGLLEKNYLPENRTYQYKFFYDNCSTRIRDIIKEVLGDRLVFDQKLNATATYRDWIQTYAGYKAIADFGMDIAIGIPSDQKTGYNGAMYIPDNMMSAFDSATVKTDSTIRSFIMYKQALNAYYVKETLKKKEINLPIILGGLLLLSSLIPFIRKEGIAVGPITTFNKVLFIIAGIAGLILTLLWFFTDHGVTMYNLNIFWANPFYLLLFTIPKKFGKRAFLITGIISASTILIDILQIQDIPLAADFIALALAARLFTIYKKYDGRTAIPNRAI
jgi:hypothetical protein